MEETSVLKVKRLEGGRRLPSRYIVKEAPGVEPGSEDRLCTAATHVGRSFSFRSYPRPSAGLV